MTERKVCADRQVGRQAGRPSNHFMQVNEMIKMEYYRLVKASQRFFSLFFSFTRAFNLLVAVNI